MPTCTTTVCCYLRWRAAEDGEPESRTPYAEHGYFVCTHTHDPVGPDDRVADEDACREGRGCFGLPDQPGRSARARTIPVQSGLMGESRPR